MPLDLREDLAAALLSPEVRRVLDARDERLIALTTERAIAAVRRDELLTLREAAEEIRIAHGTIRQAAASDPTFPRRGMGRATRVRRGDLLDWHAGRRRPKAPEFRP